MVFSREIKDNLPVEAATEFKSPIDILYGSFSYDKMKSGAQWTALWYRGTDLICYETLPWDGSTGGYGTIQVRAATRSVAAGRIPGSNFCWSGVEELR